MNYISIKKINNPSKTLDSDFSFVCLVHGGPLLAQLFQSIACSPLQSHAKQAHQALGGIFHLIMPVMKGRRHAYFPPWGIFMGPNSLIS